MNSSIKSSIKNINNITFHTKKCTDLTEPEIKMCSDLFSQNYGEWGKDDPEKRKGKKISLGVKYYKDNMLKADHYVSLAYYDEKIIGQAFYIRKKFENEECMSWVLQLVVSYGYRKIGIGKRLLYSIWGFSGDEAWGLATSNPYTVKTLESATFREVCPKVIRDNLDKVKKIGKEVPYINSYNVNLYNSVVDTEFYIDSSDTKNKIKNAYGHNWKLGELPPGNEWLAFTFKNQGLRKFSTDEFEMWIQYSESKLKEAYARMNTENQAWAKSTNREKEVDFIIKELNLSRNEKIADFGCGIGRHCIEFLNKGFNNIIGIDFVSSNIEKAKESVSTDKKSIFSEKDCRKVDLGFSYDVILCLYDVIGSFPDNKENEKILSNIYKHLSPNGYAVISVMNMELTLAKAKYVEDIINNPKSLLNLKPSKIMQKSGDIFNPEYYIIDKESKLVYRKEQFDDDGDLSAEHVIRDKRYTKDEICKMAKNIGFHVKDVRFVSAGKWQKKLNNTDPKAKEILLILQK